MSAAWRLLETGAQSAAFNMALDELLFNEALSDPDFIPTLRIYRFRRPAITFGYSQNIEEHWQRDPAYDAAKRITGGGMVFHGKDLTYSFAAPMAAHPDFKTLGTCYRAFHEVIQDAFALMDIDTDFSGLKKKEKHLKDFCFLAPVKNDVLVDGKKIAGGAQKRSAGFFLHQGSVNFRAFLNEEEDYLPFFEIYREHFIEAFKACFQVALIRESVEEDGKYESFAAQIAGDPRRTFQVQA